MLDGETVARASGAARIRDGFFEGADPRLKRPLPLSPASLRNTGRSVGASATPTPSARCSARSTTTCWSRARTAGSTNGSARISSTHEGVDGVHFAVWAPHAQRVSVVGDFNAWDGRRHQMRKRVDSGLWEIFAPEIGEGAVYKYEIVGADGTLLPLKADPFGFGSELRPSTASVVAGPTASPGPTPRLSWSPRRGGRPAAPMSIYEVHLGSWRRGEDGGFLTYDELADTLIPYAAEMGFTHLELLPISEHPLDASWGYQPIGLFAPTRALRRSRGFRALRRPRASRGPRRDPRLGAGAFPHRRARPRAASTAPRSTNMPIRAGASTPTGTPRSTISAAREVANFLAANALYWLDRFHIDGLRVDAVASMLYLDYSPQGGRMAAQRRGRQREPRGGRLPPARQYARLRRLSRRGHHRRGIDRLARRLAARRTQAASASASSGTWAGCTTRCDYMSRRSDPSPLASQQADLRPALRLQRRTSCCRSPMTKSSTAKARSLGKMPGDEWQRFANARAYYGFMWGHPGKKLLFMGQEFGQAPRMELRRRRLDWWLLDDAAASGRSDCSCAISTSSIARRPRFTPATASRRASAGSSPTMPTQSVLRLAALRRRGRSAGRRRLQFHAGAPRGLSHRPAATPGFWREIFNTRRADLWRLRHGQSRRGHCRPTIRCTASPRPPSSMLPPWRPSDPACSSPPAPEPAQQAASIIRDETKRGTRHVETCVVSAAPDTLLARTPWPTCWPAAAAAG